MQRQSRFTTSDVMTYTLAYLGYVEKQLRCECGLTVTQYRALAFLSDHPEGIASSRLAKILSVSPALITVEFNRLSEKGLAQRSCSERNCKRSTVTLTKQGVDKTRDADLVLAFSHNAFFESLPADMRIVIESGSMLTNLHSDEGNRMRDGHFFTAFETHHAFLIVVSYLTKTTQKYGLSLTEFRILFELGERGGAAPPSRLAESLLLTRPAVTHALAKLEAASFVEVLPDREDRRMKTVVMTDVGWEKLDQVATRIESVYTADIRKSSRSERDVYKDAAALIVSSLRKQRLGSGSRRTSQEKQAIPLASPRREVFTG